MPVELAGRQREEYQAKKLQKEWKDGEIALIDPFEMIRRRNIF